MLFYGGLRLFKGLRLLFLQNVPGGMFIQGAMSFLDSRVVRFYFQRWVMILILPVPFIFYVVKMKLAMIFLIFPQNPVL